MNVDDSPLQTLAPMPVFLDGTVSLELAVNAKKRSDFNRCVTKQLYEGAAFEYACQWSIWSTPWLNSAPGSQVQTGDLRQRPLQRVQVIVTSNP